MSTAFRIEADSMGEILVPAGAYYGAQTARALQNFPISSLRFPRAFIRALGLIKYCAAGVNAQLERLPEDKARAIQQAAQEVIDGRLEAHFVVDVFQTGSGTSTHMNANEVIAARANELLGEPAGERRIHPNDHVNLGQSSNDVFPSAIHLAALEMSEHLLRPALVELKIALHRKTAEFADVYKIARTHLQDATPMRLGQEFSGYASQIEHGLARLDRAIYELGELALGGTAVGTGVNGHPDFAPQMIELLARETRVELRRASNHFEAQGARDACVFAGGVLKGIAVSLIKIAGDIRLLASGPRLGLGELQLPAVQPGSSIMPGKVNPVIPEMVIQVGAQVIGHEAAITYGGSFGQLELNTMMPLIGYNLLHSIELLGNASRVFAERCVLGLTADRERCESNLERSLALATSLAPVIGYEQAAHLAKVAHDTKRTIKEVALELTSLDAARLEELLDPRKMV